MKELNAQNINFPRGFDKLSYNILVMQNLEDLLSLISLSCKLGTPLESLHLGFPGLHKFTYD